MEGEWIAPARGRERLWDWGHQRSHDSRGGPGAAAHRSGASVAAVAAVGPHLGLDLRDVIYPQDADAGASAERLKQTAVTQPALFVVEYALARLWQSRGVVPSAMIGHSVGEYVAAHLAGVFSLDDALALVAERGRLMQSMPGGAMLAVQLSEADTLPYVTDDVCLAAINGP